MSTAASILAGKPDQTLYTTTPSTSVLDAAALMVDANIGALVVMERGVIVGMVSERDFVRHARAIADAARPGLRVGDIMTTPVASVRAEQSCEECMALMNRIRFRHLPVWSDHTLRGVVSIGDLVRDVISEQRFAIGQLEQYIAG